MRALRYEEIELVSGGAETITIVGQVDAPTNSGAALLGSFNTKGGSGGGDKGAAGKNNDGSLTTNSLINAGATLAGAAVKDATGMASLPAAAIGIVARIGLAYNLQHPDAINHVYLDGAAIP